MRSSIAFIAFAASVLMATTCTAHTYLQDAIELHISEADVIVLGNTGNTYIEDRQNGDRYEYTTVQVLETLKSTHKQLPESVVIEHGLDEPFRPIFHHENTTTLLLLLLKDNGYYAAAGSLRGHMPIVDGKIDGTSPQISVLGGSQGWEFGRAIRWRRRPCRHAPRG